ncbi:MAG: hypothetical protein Q9168_007972 [Polycauliona sp. 1 TL-2023]
MWLLNTSTLALHNIISPDTVKYAILSHTWGDEEISFQDIVLENKSQGTTLADSIYSWVGQWAPTSSLKRRKGYKKVERCCALALANGYQWAWIDTVCIDKKSSAELSEAINSMYDWYGKSSICYAYMSDVSMTGKDLDATVIDDFKWSRWFRRGWTLQELLAPSDIIFYDSDWRCLGNRAQLAEHISSASGIDKRYLRSRIQTANASIATRMSWASHRSTTRLEDEAYCLLGLFQINMALLYGEGSRAFIRLQHEIIRNSDDESIFAWYTDEMYSGMLAKRPSAFAGCGDFFRYRVPKFPRTPYTMTNRGLSLDAVFKFSSKKCDDRLETLKLSDCILVPLNCTNQYLQGKPFTIILVQSMFQNFYTRYCSGEIVDFDVYCKHVFDSTERTTFYISDDSPIGNKTHNRYNEYSKYIDQFGGKLYDGLITLDRQSLGFRNTDGWFISPPGHIIRPDRVATDNCQLRLSGCSGFAVLVFNNTDGYLFCITITYGRVGQFGTGFSLHDAGSGYAIYTPHIIQDCFDQLENRKLSLEVRTEYTLQIGEGRTITLKQGSSEDEEEASFTLRMESV